jgi:hypothetical protein
MENANMVFAQLTKIDEERRLVYGRATQEVVDRSGEIFDYESSKPFFEKWGASQSEASLGKSHGNIRAMHKDIAAGIIVPGGLTFNDGEKAIDICAKIVDDNEWEKCIAGVYTGFSIGGSYAKKWQDDTLGKTRFTANPNETSLVDRPCVPTATFFDIQKADGSVMQKRFVDPAGDGALTRNQILSKLTEGGGNLDELAAKTDDELRAMLHKGDVKSDDEFMKDLHDGLAETADAEGKNMLKEAHGIYLDSDCFTKGDFDGHPFRDDQYKEGSSGAAVHASQKARGNETKTNHERAASAHRSAAKNTTGKTKAYHEKMAAFHAKAASGAKKADGRTFMTACNEAVEKGIDPNLLEGKSLAEIEDMLAKTDAGEPAELEVRGTDDDVTAFAKYLNDNKLGVADALAAMQKVAERKDVDPAEGKKKYGSVKFADAKNKKYPLDTKEHVKAALSYWGMPKNKEKYSAEDQKTIGDKIAAAAKEFGIDKADAPASLRKGLYTCSQFAQLLQSLANITESVEYEAAAEDDGSPLPAQLNAAIETLGGILVAMVEEEVAELKECDEQPNVMAMAAAAKELTKRAESICKAGARNSKADLDKIQAVHDHAVSLGAACAAAKVAKGAPALTVDEALLKSATEPLQKALDDAQCLIKKLTTDVEMLKAQPAPSKAILKVVGKGADVEDLGGTAQQQEAVEPIVKRDGNVDSVATALKKIHQTGGHQVTLHGRR